MWFLYLGSSHDDLAPIADLARAALSGVALAHQVGGGIYVDVASEVVLTYRWVMIVHIIARGDAALMQIRTGAWLGLLMVVV